MTGVDPVLARAWLAGRSFARGLPAPVPDHGGWRVDTRSAAEECRYLFATSTEGLSALGTSVTSTRIAIKLCGDADTLARLLPSRWRVDPASGATMMIREFRPAARAELPSGYRLYLRRDRSISSACVHLDGEVAATGYAAEAGGVFVYDRIVVADAHRRRGIGRAMMAALARLRENASSREILVATSVGRALYATLGWRDLSPYSTATIPG